MSLKARLSRLQAQAGVPASERPTSTSALRERLAHLRLERLTGRAFTSGRCMTPDELADVAGGRWLAEGLLIIDELVPLAELPGQPAPMESANMPRLPDEHAPPRSLYIDTETTGLSGGSGTLAFLVGLAEMDGQQIRLTQFLITRFAAETALLTQILQRMTPAHRLVSYNGKTFDLPLLIARLRMRGLPTGIDRQAHLDLLHPVRRLFQRRWEDCRLTTAERCLLHFTRHDDLPGAEAPEAWFAYLRRQDGDGLVRVLRHNRQDILSLAALHQTLGHALARPDLYGVDFLGLGRWLQQVDESQARACLASHQQILCDDAKRLLGQLLRRAGRCQEAARIWEELAASGCIDSLERLSKYHEHVSRNLQAALHYCLRLPGSGQQRQRRQRIERKLRESAERLASARQSPGDRASMA
jgi:uncharacterized protein YprB with RNaseH-like and TPR domain